MLSRAACVTTLRVSVRIDAKARSGYSRAVVTVLGSLADFATVLRRCVIALKDTKPIPTKTGSTIDISSTQDGISIPEDITIPDIASICCLYRKVSRLATGDISLNNHVLFSEPRT